MVYLMLSCKYSEYARPQLAERSVDGHAASRKGINCGCQSAGHDGARFLLQPQLVAQAWDYFRTCKRRTFTTSLFFGPDDKPAIEMNKEKMEKFRPELKKYYYDPAKYKTYLDQLGIKYPTVKAQ